MDWIHLHLALNHVPVLGTVFLFLLFCVALVRRSAELKKLSLWAFVILMLVSILINFTGDFAAETAGKLDGVDPVHIKQHEDSADQAVTGVFLLGLAAGAGLFLSRDARPLPGWTTITILLLSLGTFLLMARTANFGGRIRHPEIRPAEIHRKS